MLTDTPNPAALTALGKTYAEKFVAYAKDRLEIEAKWLRNRRQFRGEYDAEVKQKIDPNRSQAYPKVTRVKVIGMVARLMDLLFPQTAKNWNVAPTPFPDLAEGDMQTVLQQLQEAAQGGQLTDEIIEKGISEFAAKRCKRMEKTIEDQLIDSSLDYITLVRKVVFSGVLYGCGVLKGPLILRGTKRTWKKNPVTLAYEAKSVDSLKPYYEFVPTLSFYPDLTAKTRDQMDGAFERHIMNKHEVRKLADRPDFKSDVIKAYLRDYPNGNYKEQQFESQLRGEKSSTQTTVDVSAGKKYELLEWWGYVPATDLKAAGMNISDSQLTDDLTANIWLIDDKVIKIAMSPYPVDVKIHHLFVYEEDDNSLLGTALPEVIRESQLSICASARMLLDNASVTCGPIVEVNRELLAPGCSTAIHAYKVFEREGTGAEASIPAVRELRIDAHIPELTSIIGLFKDFADAEAMLPPSLMGDMSKQGKEPFRTASNTSQLMGAAALPIRDVVRNFDQFTESVIGSLYYWNMEFNEDPEVKGDYRVQAQGSTSLIAKEVRSQALDNLAVTLTPEDAIYLDRGELLRERLLVRDLPVDKLMLPDDVVKQNQAAASSKQQAMDAGAMKEMEVRIAETVTRSILNVANAEKAEAGSQIEAYTAIVSSLTGEKNGQTQPGAGAGATA